MLKYFLTFLLLFFSAENIFAQGEGNIWHFGNNAGIDFNSGSAVAISGYVHTWEGCASICDSTGSLLFSTDGVTVYDVDGGIIVAGLSGSITTTQSALIIPDPASINRYYLFSCGYGGLNPITFSIIDMSLNNGLGGMIIIDSLLANNMCEKICAVYAGNGKDIWIIGHDYGTNNFRSYRVTPTGIEVAVVSATGTPMYTDPRFAGYLKASHDGTKLATVCPGWEFVSEPGLLEIYDFNNHTGAVTNPFSMPAALTGFYGASFSPDDSKLYVSSITDNQHIIQYDLTAVSWWNSRYVVSKGGAVDFGALQLAPDGKIYCAQGGATALSTINNPNAAGEACDFHLNNFPILGSSGDGLPNHFEQLTIPKPCSINLGPDTSFCGNDSITLDAGICGVKYLWNDGSTNQKITISAGVFSVTVTDNYGRKVVDTVNISHSNCIDIKVPTGFTPNQDGVNDYFHILNAQDFLSAEIKIYNRWGELIYLSKDKNGYWNGTYLNENCEVGVYVFVISGKNYLGHDIFEKGNLTLLR